MTYLKHLLFLFLSLFCFQSQSIELVARADQFNPYLLPPLSRMPHMTPVCDKAHLGLSFWEQGDTILTGVAMIKNHKISASPGLPEDYFVSDMSLVKGKIVFSANTRGDSLGVFSWNALEGLNLLTAPKDFPDVVSFTRPSLINDEVLFRGLNYKGERRLILGSKTLLKETENIAYIFLPTAKNNEFVLQVSYGKPGKPNPKNQDRILIYTHSKFHVLVEDKDSNPKSIFQSFDPSPQPDGKGGAVFVAQTRKYGRSLWHVNKNKKLFLLYSPKKSNFGEIEHFAPATNSRKDVAFRVLKNKKRALLAWDHKVQKIKLIAKQSQSVKTNEPNLRIIDRKNWPAFSGSPCVTKDRKVYFHAVLEESSSYKNKGSGVFKVFL